MRKKPATPNPTPGLPGIEGKGISPLVIPDISKAASKYERMKEKRCQASPGEIAAKRELEATLHKHAERLPKNGDGHRFYQVDDVQYVLTEKLVRRRSGGEEGANGDE